MRLPAAVAVVLILLTFSDAAEAQAGSGIAESSHSASTGATSGATVAHFTAAMSPSPVHPGEIALIKISATIDPPFHIYSIVSSPGQGPSPTKITANGHGITSSDPVVEDKPTVAFDDGFGKNVAYHAGSALFTVPVRVGLHDAVGKLPLSVGVTFQACNDKYCLPPASVQLPMALVVLSGPVRAAFSTAPKPLPAAWANPQTTGTARSSAAAKPTGLLGFIVAAFAAGLLALLTPCVFPLIPVTFGYFTKQLGASGGRLVALAASYSIGIVLSFTLLGLIVAATVGENGPNRIAANPWFNVLFGLLFVVFGFAFFETFTPQLPGFLQRFARPAKTSSSFATVLLMGLAFVFAAFTCTAPFVATVLSLAVTASHSGGWLRPVLGMVFFSLALALPFFLLSLFPSLLARLPRSGSWLSITKAVLGFVELAFAMLYFSKADLVWQARLLTRPVIFGVWACIAVCGALYLLGALKVSRYQEAFDRMTPGRGLGAALFALCAAYCFYAQSGRPVNAGLGAFLPPPGYGGASDGTVDSIGSITWHTDYRQALSLAQSTGKPVFIDFTGYTCTNCRWMELNIFPKPLVADLLRQYVTVRLYTDGGADGPKNQALQTRLAGEVAQPLYALIAPDGHKIDQSVGLDSNPAHLAAFLSQGLASAAQLTSTTVAQPALVSSSGEGSVDASSAKPWVPYVSTALALARAAHEPMIVDFSADWCVPCHAIEKSVFPNPAVAALTPKFATYMANLTSYGSPQSKKLEDQFGIDALPTIVFITADGAEAPNTRVTGIISPSDFAARMKQTLSAGS